MAAVFANRGSRRALVKNIPTNTKFTKLVIYFQKTKHGGRGDVVSLTFPKSLSEPGQAVVEFESQETLHSVLQKTHVFGGQPLQLTPFPNQAFEKTGVVLSDETVDKLNESGHYQRIIDCTGVKLTSQHQKHQISGEWYQVYAAVEQITQILSPKTNSERSERSSSLVAETSTGASNIVQNGKLNGSNSSGADPKAPKRRQSAGGEEPKAEVAIDWNVLEYMKRCHPDRMKTLGKKHKLRIVEERTKVSFVPSRANGVKAAKEAAKDFNEIFSKFHSQVRNTRFDLADLKSATKDEIRDAITSANKQEKIFVGKSSKHGEENIIVFLGLTQNDVKSAAEDFRSMFAPEKRVVLKEIPVLGSELRVSVRHGNFRKEKTDAILSEVDLFCKGSVLEECGLDVKDDVVNWLRSVRPESWNSPVHMTAASDSLRCKRIIHYYLNSQIRSDEALERGFLMCLEFANKENFTSLAISMNYLGAGVNTSELNLVLFEAIRSFVTTHQQSRPNLKKIHVVHSNLAEAKRIESTLETLSYAGASGTSSSSQSSRSSTEEENEETCPICLDGFTGAMSLKKLPCDHVFHQDCIDRAFSVSKKCPMCMRFYGKPEGTQPRNGTMNSRVLSQRLPGYTCDTIVIDYNIPSGTQGPEHPNPGQRYNGAFRTAYLPNNPEGRELLRLLRAAFEARLVFTVGRSVTSGRDNCVTWNDIHHKTNIHGGPTGFGYPDPTYLQRLRLELSDKGITRDSL